jgi:hypothetical protein
MIAPRLLGQASASRASCGFDEMLGDGWGSGSAGHLILRRVRGFAAHTSTATNLGDLNFAISAEFDGAA